MVEEIKIFGKGLALPAIRGWGWRACRILFGARVRSFQTPWRFSEAENLLYLLVKRDAYLMTLFFAPFGLSAPRIRQLQREKKRAAHADVSATLNEVAATAAAIAHEFRHAVVSTEHLLLALLRKDDNSAHLLSDYGVTYEGVAEVVSRHGLSSLYIELRLPRPKFYTSKIR